MKIIYCVIADATIGKCKINPSWQHKEVIQSVLAAIGLFKKDNIDKVAEYVINNGKYQDATYNRVISYLCIGSERFDNENEYNGRYRNVKQIIWNDVFKFIFERFKRYDKEKSNHEQWDNAGKLLWDYYKRYSEVSDGSGIYIKALNDLIKHR